MYADLFQLLLPWLLILLAMFTGTLLEKAHFRRIHRRERELSGMPTLNTKRVPGQWVVAESSLVMGDVVVSETADGAHPKGQEKKANLEQLVKM